VSESQAGGVSDDPGRIIFDLEEQLKAANATISDQSAENERLQAEWQSQSTTAQQLRSDGDRLRSEVKRLERQSAEYDLGWKNAISTLAERLTENTRLQAEWQTEFTAAQQLRSENERLKAEIERLRTELLQSEARNTADAEAAEYAARLEGLLDNSREALRELQEDHTEMDHRAEGARSAYLGVIKTLWETRR